METVGDRIKKYRRAKEVSQGELATLCGWDGGQKRVSNYESGLREPSYSDLAKIGKALGVSPAHLAYGGSAGQNENTPSVADAEFIETEVEPWDSKTPIEADEVAVPFFTEVEAAAGAGNVVHIENHGPKLRFAKSTLRRAGVNPEDVVCIKVSGNSMEPVIPDGAVIGVDTGSTNVKGGDMYAIQHGDMLRVKVVYPMPTGYRLKSFNEDEWPIELVEGEAAKGIKVVGRVFWYSVLR